MAYVYNLQQHKHGRVVAASNPEGRTWEVLPSAKLIVVFRPLSSYNLLPVQVSLYTTGVLPQAVPVLILSYRVLTVQPHLVPLIPVLVFSALRK